MPCGLPSPLPHRDLYELNWERRCKQALLDIFSSMKTDQVGAAIGLCTSATGRGQELGLSLRCPCLTNGDHAGSVATSTRHCCQSHSHPPPVQEYVDKHVKPRYQVCQLYCFCVLALLLRGPRSSQCVQRLHQTCSDSSQPAAVVSLPSLGTRGPVQYTRRICRLTLTTTT